MGLQYYNCADNMLVKDIIDRLEMKRSTAMIRHFSRNQECARLLNKTNIYTERMKESTITVSIQRWINNSCCANVAMNKCDTLCKTKAMNSFEKEIYRAKKYDDVCKDTDVFKSSLMIGQHEEQIYNYNKNYRIVESQGKSELKR